MDFEGTKAAILKVEQAITLMDNRLQHKLRPEQREALANAILSSGAQDDLLFHHRTVRKRPPLWTLGGFVAALRLQWARRVSKIDIPDEAEQLSLWAAAVRRSGARRLLVAMLIALVCGMINLGLPVEMAIQALRDKARPVQASGEIVVIAKDDRSLQAIGQLPWSRRYDAMLLDRLRELGAKRIVFNEIFDRESDEREDAAFVGALKRSSGKVWLSAYSEVDQMTGKSVDFVPLNKFNMSCCLVNNYIWYNAFGVVDNFPYFTNISSKYQPSSAVILGDGTVKTGPMRPDSAILVRSIPKISAYEIIYGKINKSKIYNKSVIIGITSSNADNKEWILGQGKFSGVLVRALAAESLRNGIAKDIGWIPPILFFALVGLLCIVRATHTERIRILISGALVLLILTIIGDRVGLYLEIVPAIVGLIIFGIRDHMQRQLLTVAGADPVSGLPRVSELAYIRKYDRCVVAALKVERFAMHMAGLEPIGQRHFVRSVAARINIIFPEQVVHQGEEGLFVWLVPPERDYEPLSYIAQLTALFRLPIGGHMTAHDVGVAIGFGSNLNDPFAARLAVATDRARISLFGTLTSVQ
jgi:diguanylate cyclase